MRHSFRRFALAFCSLLSFSIFFVFSSEGQIAHFGKPLSSRQSNSSDRSFSDLTASAADPADSVCARSAAGAAISDPPSVSSQNGVLEVTFNYQTTVDENGLTRYCYVYTNAAGQAEESPTLEVNPGDTLIINFSNNLPVPSAAEASAHPMHEMKMTAVPQAAPTSTSSDCSATAVTSASTNLHFHGTNVAPVCGQDEVVHTVIPPQSSFTYTVQIPANEPPGAYWYHPHPHGFSDPQLLGGASGVILVGGIENVNPIVAGLPERVFVMRDQDLPASESNDSGIPKTDLSINYVPILYPSYTPAQIQTGVSEQEFWRVLNTSADTLLNIEVIDNGVAQSLQIVSVDGVPLTDSSGNATTSTVTSYVMSPASRVEFIVTTPALGDTTAQLVTQTWDNGPTGDNDPGRPIANITAVSNSSTTVAVKRVPARTTARQVTRFTALDSTTPATQRTLYFSVASDFSAFYITVDGQTPAPFSMDGPPNITVTEGTVEQWTIQNRSTMDHNFHIHQLHFQTLAINGTPVTDTTRRDTIDIPHWSGNASDPYPSVTLLMDFRDPNIVGTFVYHCHILSHEDLGMMGMIQVLPGATTTTLTASPSTTSAGTSVALTATVAPAAGSGTPTGTVTFLNGSTILGTGTLNSSGVATLNLATLPLGANSITANYSGDTSFASSTATALTVTVTAATTTTSLTSSAASILPGASVTFTATVTATAGTGTPAGTVSFANGATTLGNSTLNASGVASYTTTSLPTGGASITAAYAGSSSFAASSSTAVPVSVQAATTTTALTASAATITVGGAVTFTATVAATPAGSGTPSGSVTFLSGTATLGTAALNVSGVATYATNALPAGNASVTASYGGNADFSASNSAAVPITVTLIPTTTSLTASPTAAVSGASVTFTAVVAGAAGSGTPAGSVTFNNGSATLSIVTLNGTGTASYSTTTLPIGSAAVTATYGGNSSFASSASTAAMVIITAPPPPDFSVALSPASLSVAPGATGTTTVTITPLNGFNSAVTFACTGFPNATTWTFSPTTVTPDGTHAISTTMTVSTTASSASLLHPLSSRPRTPLYALVLPGLGALLGLSNLRRGLPTSRRWLGMALFAIAVAFGVGACGGGSMAPSNPGTTPGTSLVTITATSGTTSHTTTLSLTVSQ
jgi:FtsP/CotA-like multicopper oxidase with cupredoxin domain